MPLPRWVPLLVSAVLLLSVHWLVRSWPQLEYVNGLPIGERAPIVWVQDGTGEEYSLFAGANRGPYLLTFLVDAMPAALQRVEGILNHPAYETAQTPMIIVAFGPLMAVPGLDLHELFPNATVFYDFRYEATKTYQVYQSPTVFALDERGVIRDKWGSDIPEPDPFWSDVRDLELQ